MTVQEALLAQGTVFAGLVVVYLIGVGYTTHLDVRTAKWVHVAGFSAGVLAVLSILAGIWAGVN